MKDMDFPLHFFHHYRKIYDIADGKLIKNRGIRKYDETDRD